MKKRTKRTPTPLVAPVFFHVPASEFVRPARRYGPRTPRPLPEFVTPYAEEIGVRTTGDEPPRRFRHNM